MRHNLTELAGNPDFISGIYNYCDRWCERCPFTSRCLVYATEKEDDDQDPHNRDITNEAFWRKLSAIFQETQQMLAELAEEQGIDLREVDEEAVTRSERRRFDAEQDKHAIAARDYAIALSQWFTEFDQIINTTDLKPDQSEVEEKQQIEDAREVLQWYQYQIAVKIMRALSSRSNEEEWLGEVEDGEEPTRDSDGSAKVALVAIDRSISAWRLMQMSLPERADSIIPLIFDLERLRQKIELRFPNARDFIRPGFDEVLGKAN